MKRILVLILGATLVLGLVACAGGSAGGGRTNVLTAYLEEYGDPLREMIEPLGAAFGEGGRVDVFAEGDDTLVFAFIYDYNLPSEIMPSIMESMEVFLQSFADGLREELEFPELIVIARYIDTNDNLFEEQSF